MAAPDNDSLRAAPLAGDETIAFTFEDRALQGRRGESLAAALTAAGERGLRIAKDGRKRGVFCGMGVCQDCLVEIDGKPGQRACMTKLEQPMTVRRQMPIPGATEVTAREAASAAALTPEILVLGGGAAGLNAAITAAESGAKVLLIDERPMAGGQFFKQRLESPAVAYAIPDDAQFSGGRALLARAKTAGVEIMPGCQVWGAFEPIELMLFDGSLSRLCRPQRLIVATGAYERGLPVPGWTLPGVMTTGAAQTLLRSYGVLAGQRILIAGNGPLNLQVAIELARAGASVLAIAELAPAPGFHSSGALAAMATSTPDLLLQGWRYNRELARQKIPLRHGHVLASVEQRDGGLRAKLAPWPRADHVEPQAFDADAVLMGYGFMPSNETLRALGCRHDFDAGRGQLITQRDADCRTSIAEIYAAGDCCGLGGARAAEAEGIIAGAAASASLGHAPSAPSAVLAARSALKKHRRFQRGLWRLFAARRPVAELAHPATLICRCEERSLSEIGEGFAQGVQAQGAQGQNAQGLGAVKRLTRAGMGRCQGRYCGPVLAALSADEEAVLGEAAFWAPRPPIKPIAIADIVAGS